MDQQSTSFDYLRKSIQKSFDYVYGSKNSIKQKFNEMSQANKQILVQYVEGISELKQYELHPTLKKDGKKMLIDVYYDEKSMNKWRDSCVKNQEGLKLKMDKFEQELLQVRLKVQERRSIDDINFNEGKSKDIFKKIEAMLSEREPLIISLLSTVYEDLKEIHSNLNIFCTSDP